MCGMESPTVLISVPVTATATADHEAKQLEFQLRISTDGQVEVVMISRKTGGTSLKFMQFDAYEWARLKKAFAEIDELIAKVESGGAVFKIG